MARGQRTKIMQVAAYVYSELREHGAVIKCAAVTTNSVYIKFDKEWKGQLRISDHPGKKHLRYRWNILVEGGTDVIDNGMHICTYVHYEAFVAYMKRVFELDEGLRKSRAFNL